MVTEAIILAGGLGTRLRDAVPGVPKALAPVAGQPFLYYVINNLRLQGIQHFIFSLGYRSDLIERYLEEHFSTLMYSIVVEKEPLGTGGAIKLALEKAETQDLLIANGDTLFKVDADSLFNLHEQNNAECTLALKPMKDFERYGVVELDESSCITSFREKSKYSNGLINGGIYLINKTKFLRYTFPQKFSFEKEYLEKYCNERIFYGSVQDGYFIDIGIPKDFSNAQNDLQKNDLNLNSIDNSWTLFLDRDGVINNERVGEYVLKWNQFIFSKGVLEAFKNLSKIFGKIIVVSNQRGVGRGLMTQQDLLSIHFEMKREVEIVNGKIDAIYYCTDTESTSFCRKPNPGMAVKAKKEFPQIDFQKSIMVGNKPSDMAFGRAAGMHTVFLMTTNPDQEYPHPDIDLQFSSLEEFASNCFSR